MTIVYPPEYNIDEVIKGIYDEKEQYEILHDRFISYLNRNATFKTTVHSFKSRFKDKEHLIEKIHRKNNEDAKKDILEQCGLITYQNIKSRITDYCGIRVLHLHQNQFIDIHQTIREYVDSGDIALFEEPKAYTWDPEVSSFFESQGINAQVKESSYTSVHYVIKPRPDNEVTCEIQVRTLFEEVWGEIDHLLNYPKKTESVSCREQLRALAKLVGSGSRLVDSIIRSNKEFHEKVMEPVCYGDIIKLKHFSSDLFLHSHPIKYSHPNSSAQQQVTTFSGFDRNNYWIVKGPFGSPQNYKFGEPVSNEDILRFEHLSSNANLHSHSSIPSPLSEQQEVTVFRDLEEGDHNDNWKILIPGKDVWTKRSIIYLEHNETNKFLCSTNLSHPEYTANQKEVAGSSSMDDSCTWILSK